MREGIPYNDTSLFQDNKDFFVPDKGILLVIENK